MLPGPWIGPGFSPWPSMSKADPSTQNTLANHFEPLALSPNSRPFSCRPLQICLLSSATPPVILRVECFSLSFSFPFWCPRFLPINSHGMRYYFAYPSLAWCGLHDLPHNNILELPRALLSTAITTATITSVAITLLLLVLPPYHPSPLFCFTFSKPPPPFPWSTRFHHPCSYRVSSQRIPSRTNHSHYPTPPPFAIGIYFTLLCGKTGKSTSRLSRQTSPWPSRS